MSEVSPSPALDSPTPAVAEPQSALASIGFVVLLAMIGIAAAGKAVLFDTMDPDAFWHLRVAEQLHRDGIGPIVDEISFASIREPWTPYSWLAELGMKAVWDAGGYRPAVALEAIAIAGYYVFLALACLQLAGPNRKLVSAVTTFLMLLVTMPYFSFRPVTFALSILAVCAYLILRDRRLEQKSRTIWLLIPICALLTNTHFFAVLVPAWLMLLTAGAWIEKKTRKAERGTRNEENFHRYLVLSVATLIACLMTPLLPGVVKSMLHYRFADVMVSSGVIAEMQPFWRGVMGIPAGVVAILSVVFAIKNRSRLSVGLWLWLALGIALLLYLGRFAPVYALIAGPVLAMTMPGLSDRAIGRPIIVAMLATLTLILAARVYGGFPKSGTPLSQWLNRNGPEFAGYPCAAADFIEHRVKRESGHVITEFTWGGYVAWRLGSDYKVLLDGRTQVFPASLWQATYLGDEADRQKFLASITADAAVLPAGKSKFRRSLVNLGWTRVFKDDWAEVYVPPTATIWP